MDVFIEPLKNACSMLVLVDKSWTSGVEPASSLMLKRVLTFAELGAPVLCIDGGRPRDTGPASRQSCLLHSSRLAAVTILSHTRLEKVFSDAPLCPMPPRNRPRYYRGPHTNAGNHATDYSE